jgi:hypothetical protein
MDKYDWGTKSDKYDWGEKANKRREEEKLERQLEKSEPLSFFKEIGRIIIGK